MQRHLTVGWIDQALAEANTPYGPLSTSTIKSAIKAKLAAEQIEPTSVELIVETIWQPRGYGSSRRFLGATITFDD